MKGGPYHFEAIFVGYEKVMSAGAFMT